MRSVPTLLVCLSLLLSLAACGSTGTAPTLEELFRRSLEGEFDPAGRPRRLADVRNRLEAPELEPRERVFGALLLLDSGEVPDLELAYVAAETAAAAGVEAARPVMAQAIDRALFLQGYAQKYGTQYVQDDEGRWQLYRVDEATTDAERAEYSVPPLSEALQRVAELNARSERDG